MDKTSLEMKLKSLDLKHNPIFTKKDHLKYVQDWRGQYKGDAAAILKPTNTKEVSRILKLANDNKIGVLVITNNKNEPIGITHIQDLLKAGAV